MPKLKIAKPVTIIVLVAVIAISPVIVLFSLNAFAWTSIFVVGELSPNPPKPEVTYAEFPFEIVYELDGTEITVNDVYVCEFDGFSWNEGVGKHRQWKGYLKSSGEEDLILLEDGNLKLACSLGGPLYYMGEPSMSMDEYTPYIFYIIHPDEFGGTTSGVGDIEPLLEQYKIKLVSWKLSDPIENSFE